MTQVVFFFAAILPIILQIIGIVIKIPTLNMHPTLRGILYDPWQAKITKPSESLFKTYDKAVERLGEYFNVESLSVFQKYYVNDSIEAVEIFNHVKNINFLKYIENNELKLLDIGGFDGVFTSNLSDIFNAKYQIIDVIDPLTKKTKYISQLSNYCSDINIHKSNIEDYLPNENYKYDIILASHSLYSCLDYNDENGINIITKLKSYLSDNGLIMIILGSEFSTAYDFKQDVASLVLNSKINDINSNSFYRKCNLELNDQELNFKGITVDNYINVTKLQSNLDDLYKWVRYFTRTVIPKDHYVRSQIINLLLFYSMEKRELPECVRDQSNLSNLELDTLLMLHKTQVFFISKNENIISQIA